MRTLIIVILALTALAFSYNFTGKSETGGVAVSPQDTVLNYTVKAEAEFKNLKIYFLSADKKLDGINYMILSEALEKKLAVINETGTVSELTITNNSDEYIFINAGDIVKGGKQDRTIGMDIIVPPREKGMKLQSFCVEASRWTKRGNEEVGQFSSNDAILPSRTLKIAAAKEKDQSAVWENISVQQDNLSENVSNLKGSKTEVRSAQSRTSLQLTLENKDLDSLRNIYRNAFENMPGKDNEITGFAYAVNGEIFGADLYGSRRLFIKMWPKLLNSVVVEAIAELKNDTNKAKPQNPVETLAKCYLSGNKTVQAVNLITESHCFENDKSIVFETYDLAHKSWIHKSFLLKDPNQKITPKTDFNRINIRDNNINNMIQQQEVVPDHH